MRAPLGAPRFAAPSLQARNRRGIAARRADAYHARRAQRVGEQQPRASAAHAPRSAVVRASARRQEGYRDLTQDEQDEGRRQVEVSTSVATTKSYSVAMSAQPLSPWHKVPRPSQDWSVCGASWHETTGMVGSEEEASALRHLTTRSRDLRVTKLLNTAIYIMGIATA
jgi:hypothetical protein